MSFDDGLNLKLLSIDCRVILVGESTFIVELWLRVIREGDRFVFAVVALLLLKWILIFI